MSLQIFDWKQFARHSFSVFEGISTLAQRWTITEIPQQLNSVLTYSLLTDVLL